MKIIIKNTNSHSLLFVSFLCFCSMSAQFDEWDVTDVSMHALFSIRRLLLSDQFRVFVFENILLRITRAFEICTLAHIRSLR